MSLCEREDETEKPESSSVIRASRGEKLQHPSIYGGLGGLRERCGVKFPFS